jgi:hypothetical protein
MKRSKPRMIGILLLPACVAGVCAAACATTSPPVHGSGQQRVDSAQAESEAAYARATRAQRDATASSARATRAEDEALAKQADAQRAAARARELRAAAEDAQRRAIQEGQEAQAQALRAQRRALDAQPTAQAQAQASGATASAVGTVQRSVDDELVIDRENAPSLRLKLIDHDTIIMMNGETAAPAELMPGMAVTVTYRIERDQPVAQRIEAGPAPLVGSPGSPAH